MTPDPFDFRGLATHPPSGLRVIDADEKHFHATRTTASGEKHFFIIKRGDRFELYSQTGHLGAVGLEALNDSHRIIVADELNRILTLLGYGRTPRPRRPHQRRAF